MISEELYHLQPELTYKDIPLTDGFFVGVKIKNLYDEKRLCLQETYNPDRYKINENIKLYGVFKEILPEHKSLVNNLKKQGIFDLIGYNILLQDYKLSCNECYYNLNPPVYPIDNIHIKKYLPDYEFENFICFNTEIPKFQAFASLSVFFYVNN